MKKSTMFTTVNIILIATATAAALMAGLFYAWSVSVMPGLARISDRGFMESMQSMNRAILNPVFFMGFMGTLLLLPVSSFLHYSQPLSARFLFLLAATIVYAAGVFGVTMFGNVPLNNALEAFHLQGASEEAIAAQRAAFEGRWNSLNTIRTLSAILTIVLVIMACLSAHKLNHDAALK